MKLNIIDLNKLKCFQAVARSGSLLTGASEIGLTSSAVYQSISKLEEDIGRKLFFRSGKKYILSDEGKELQKIFARFTHELENFQEKLNPREDFLQGKIRIGLPLNFSKLIFIPVVKKFNEQYPYVQFHLTIAESKKLLEQVADFALDFAITDDSFSPQFSNKIVRSPVFKEELVLVCSKIFFRQHEKHFLSSAKMKELNFLGYAEDLPFVQRWFKLHYKKQIKIQHYHVIDNVETMAAALRQGMGLGIIPSGLLKDATLTKDLHVVKGEGSALYNQLYLAQSANYINSVLLKKFLSFFSEQLPQKK